MHDVGVMYSRRNQSLFHAMCSQNAGLPDLLITLAHPSQAYYAIYNSGPNQMPRMPS